MADQDTLKRQAAREAVAYIARHLVDEVVIGVGTGSTVDFFIEELAVHKGLFRGAVASSERTARHLQAVGISVLDLNTIERMPVYVDGADEINARLEMIKGGGGALTREKIVADRADAFVCIADASKYVAQLGAFPLPIEVIPMAKKGVVGALRTLGATVVKEREGFITDNGHIILDVQGLDLSQPAEKEAQMNNIPGVVCCGLFAIKPAQVLLLATPEGVKQYEQGGVTNRFF